MLLLRYPVFCTWGAHIFPNWGILKEYILSVSRQIVMTYTWNVNYYVKIVNDILKLDEDGIFWHINYSSFNINLL